MLAQNGHSNNPQEVQEWPQVHQLQPCPYCRAKVYVLQEYDLLTKTVTGRWAVVDYGQTAGGNVIINITAGTYQLVDSWEREVYKGWRHALHRNICPRVDEWYRGR